MSGRRERETILLTVDEIGDRFADVGPTSSVLALARELNGSDESSYLSLYVHRLARTLSPNLPALVTDIRSGDVVRVVLAEPEVGSFLTSDGDEEASGEIQGATLHMLSGPLSGSAYQLAVGANRVGRVSDNDVVLVDAGVSRHHATITVDPDGVKITDNQSTNGIRVDGKPIEAPTPVQSGQRVLLGRCWVTITFAGATASEETTEREAAKQSLYLERSPRDTPRFEAQTVNLPTPPAAGGRRRRSGGPNDPVAVEQFKVAVATVINQLDELQQTEAATRRAESPSIESLASQIYVDGKPNPALLWQREAADVDGLDVRLGLATQLSRTTVVLPPGGDPDLRSRVVELPERYRNVDNVPAVINLREVGSVGIHGSAEAAQSLTRSMISQLAIHHGPDQLGILYRSGEGVQEWDWLKWLPHIALSGTPVGVKDTEFVSAVSTFLGGARVKRNDRHRPPAIVVLIDDPGALPPALFPRLVQEGPDVGVYPVLLGGDEFPFDVVPAATIRVGVESANLSLADGTHVGGITIESTDRPAAVAMARSMTSVNFQGAVPLVPVADDQVPGPDELFVGRFQLGGTPPPHWPTLEPVDAPVEDAASSVVPDDQGVGELGVEESAPASEVDEPAAAEDVVAEGDVPEAGVDEPEPGEPVVAEAEAEVEEAALAPEAVEPEPEPEAIEPEVEAEIEAAELQHAEPEVEAAEPEPAASEPDSSDEPELTESAEVEVEPAESEAVELAPAAAEPEVEAADPEPEEVAADPIESVAEAAVMMPPPPTAEDAIALDPIPDPVVITSELEQAEDAPDETSEEPMMAATDTGPVDVDPSITQETPETAAENEAESESVEEPPAPVVVDDGSATELDIRDTPPPPSPPPVPEEEPEPAAVAEAQPQVQPESSLLLSALPPADGDSRLILGTVQVPDRPNPAVFAMNLPRDGSLGLVGPPGSGRTAALHSVAAATALLSVAPDSAPIVYYLDVPGELDVLKALPNAVGATKNDIDGFRAVTADLERLLIDRRAAFDELGAGNLDEYRHLQPGANLRRIVTLIDNIASFGELMEALHPGRFIALLQAMLSDGPALGVHLVFTGNQHDDLGTKLGRQVGRWLTLGGGGPEGMVRPGKAMVGRNEVRFAVVGSADAAQAIANIGARMVANGATPINNPAGPVHSAG